MPRYTIQVPIARTIPDPHWRPFLLAPHDEKERQKWPEHEANYAEPEPDDAAHLLPVSVAIRVGLLQVTHS